MVQLLKSYRWNNRIFMVSFLIKINLSPFSCFFVQKGSFWVNFWVIFWVFEIFENGIGIRNTRGNNFVFWWEMTEASFMPKSCFLVLKGVFWVHFWLFEIFENGIGIRNPKGNNFVFYPEVSEASFMPKSWFLVLKGFFFSSFLSFWNFWKRNWY